MSETSFPVNDIFRRRGQTELIMISLAMSVAATVFILLFAERLGFSVSSVSSGRLTYGLSAVFSPFLTMLVILAFVVGIVLVSFLGYLMMSQRSRDIGLMKSAGCPNDLVFGYFTTELLIVVLTSCAFGVALGIGAIYLAGVFFVQLGVQIPQKPINVLLVAGIFVVSLIFSFVFGVRSVYSQSKLTPFEASSPAHYMGVGKDPGFRVFSRFALTLRIAIRSIFRRKSASLRVILCLSFVFVLITVAISGSVIANDTTRNWIERAVGHNTILIAHRDVTTQYQQLLSTFYSSSTGGLVNYTDPVYSVPPNLRNELAASFPDTVIESRLILEIPVKEVQSFVLGETTGATRTIGDHRASDTLIMGVEPAKTASDWYIYGRFLDNDTAPEAVIGDSLAQSMFEDPQLQKIRMFSQDVSIVGVCLDPINMGNVTYVPLKFLQEISNTSQTNALMLRMPSAADLSKALDQIRAIVEEGFPNFEAGSLEVALDRQLDFVSYIWSTVTLLPLIMLGSASLCLIGYEALIIGEQRQELGILRALGLSPGTTITFVLTQTFLVLIASCGLGVSLGIIITLLVLVEQPVITFFTVLEVTAMLLLSTGVMFVASYLPAHRLSKEGITTMISKP